MSIQHAVQALDPIAAFDALEVFRETEDANLLQNVDSIPFLGSTVLNDKSDTPSRVASCNTTIATIWHHRKNTKHSKILLGNSGNIGADLTLEEGKRRFSISGSSANRLWLVTVSTERGGLAFKVPENRIFELYTGHKGSTLEIKAWSLDPLGLWPAQHRIGATLHIVSRHTARHARDALPSQKIIFGHRTFDDLSMFLAWLRPLLETNEITLPDDIKQRLEGVSKRKRCGK
jgi:hypothetical protein